MASELQDIQLTEAKPLLVENVPSPAVPVIPEAAEGEVSAQAFVDVESKEHDIQTGYGLLHVTVRGSGKGNRPAILTYHDIGLNHKSCFNALFNYEDMQEIIKNFAVYHIDAPGQQPGAPLFPQGYQYPSMDQLADMLPGVMTHFSLKSIIGIGVGAGSYVLARMAMNNPSLVEGLVLINIEPHAKGWFDWAASKITNLTNTLTDTVLSHHFSQSELSNNADLMMTYKQHMLEEINQQNLSLFVNAYNSRRDLDLGKASLGQPAKTLKCPVMLVVGDSSPMVDAVVECNSKLDPTQTSFLKMSDCGGLPQCVQPAKLTEAFKYFVQGMGYMPSAMLTRLSRSRTASRSSSISGEDGRTRARTRTNSESKEGQYAEVF